MQASTIDFPLSKDALAELVRGSVPAVSGIREAVASAVPAYVAIGAFDGVHRGHRALIEACMNEARARDGRSVVVTFDPDPSELIAGASAERQLLSVRDRAAICQALGVDEILLIPFTSEFAKKKPIDFVDYLLQALGTVAQVHVGTNFRFGHFGAGHVDTLRGIGEHLGFSVVAHDLLTCGDAPVSSTRIRALLAEGHVGEAAALLGRCHFIRGSVAHGRGEGTSFGFPTANVRCDARSCMPSEGVYACVVTDGTMAWPAAANVGTPPTFESRHDACFLEANLLGFEGDLYGRELAVMFVAWLRASRPFSSLEELERVVLGNIDWVRRNVGESGVEVRA